MIQSTLGRAPRHETFKQYPQGMHPLMYEIAALADSGEFNEDTKEMYVNKFSHKLMEERDENTLKYFQSINGNRTEKYRGVDREHEEKDEEDKILKECEQYKNSKRKVEKNGLVCVEFFNDDNLNEDKNNN